MLFGAPAANRNRCCMLLQEVADPAVGDYPSYYTQPFHAYKQVGGRRAVQGRAQHSRLAAIATSNDCDARPVTQQCAHSFAARAQGNLCWDAALEFALASASVHAPVMDPGAPAALLFACFLHALAWVAAWCMFSWPGLPATGAAAAKQNSAAPVSWPRPSAPPSRRRADNKVMDREGIAQLRASYGRAMLQLLRQLPGALAPADVTAVLDVGCATGLSSLALRQLFPGAHVTGVDLSPHMLAVGRYFQQQREVRAG